MRSALEVPALRDAEAVAHNHTEAAVVGQTDADHVTLRAVDLKFAVLTRIRRHPPRQFGAST